MSSESSSEFADAGRQEALRSELRQRLSALLDSGIPVQDIAKLLDANQYLRVERSRSIGAGNVLVFDALGFVDDVIRSDTQLQFPTAAQQLDETILPPDEGEIQRGSGEGFEPKGIIPRTRYCIELLGELRLDYTLIQGKNNVNMLRKESYLIFALPASKKMVFVCNEEGNATFIVFDINIDNQQEWRQYSELTKEQLKQDPRVQSMSWPGDKEKWKQQLLEVLTSERAESIQSIPSDPYSKIAKRQVDGERPPEGWLTVSGICHKIGRSNSFIERRLDDLGRKYPDEVRRYLGSKNIEVEHFGPTIIMALEQSTREYQFAPLDWFTEAAICQKIGRKAAFTHPKIQTLVVEFPDSVEKYFDKDGRALWHYGPEIVAKLESLALAYPAHPAGWLARKNIARKLGKSEDFLAARLDQLEEQHPDEVGMYLNTKHQRWKHYSPQIVEIISRDYAKLETAPKGWLTAFQISKQLNRVHRERKRIARYLRALAVTYPNEAGEYLNDRNNLYWHFSPRMFELLQDKLRNDTRDDENGNDILSS